MGDFTFRCEMPERLVFGTLLDLRPEFRREFGSESMQPSISRVTLSRLRMLERKIACEGRYGLL
jgi:hypothetical protein